MPCLISTPSTEIDNKVANISTKNSLTIVLTATGQNLQKS